MYVHYVVPENTQHKIYFAANSELFVNTVSCALQNILRIINTTASILRENMLVYLSLDIICSLKLTVFLELRSRRTVHILEQIVSADKYPCIFLRQIEAISYLLMRFSQQLTSDNFLVSTLATYTK